MGNSAMDIAVEASFVASDVFLAARRGAWVIPKYLFGRPLDTLTPSARVPFAVRRRAQQTMLKLMVGDMERYGLPKPDHGLLEAHPTVSDDALSRIAHGEITPKPNIAELTERTVRFADGSEVEADVVVYCTGYKVTFPFLDPELIAAPDNDLPLFRRVFHPEIGGVYFVGLLQPLGAVMPLAELQSEWICDHLAGRYHLPPDAELRADIEAERAAMFKRYVASKRHTMQVDFEDYVLASRQERRRGERRAALAGQPAARGAGGPGVTATATGRRERTKAANRAALLEAARDAFGELGFEAVGVRDIVRRTDLASGTFYNYFEDKESVFRAVVEATGAEARRRVRAARAGARSLTEFVEAGYRAYFSFIVEDPATFLFLRRNLDAAGCGRHRGLLAARRGRAGRGPRGARGARRAAGARPRLLRPRDGRRGDRARRAHGRARAARRRGRDAIRRRAVPGRPHAGLTRSR